MAVAPAVCVAKLHVVHCWLALLCGGTGHALCGVGICAVTVQGATHCRNGVVVSATAEHSHYISIYLILLGEAPGQSGTAEYVVGVVAADVCLLLIQVRAIVLCVGYTLVFESHVTVVESHVCVDLSAAVVDVSTGIVAKP